MTDLIAALDSKESNEPLIETLMMLEILRAENGDLQARVEAAEAERDACLRRLIESDAAQLPLVLELDVLREEIAALRARVEVAEAERNALQAQLRTIGYISEGENV